MRDKSVGMSHSRTASWLDFCLPLGLVLFLGILSFHFSPQHLMWGDELLAWPLLEDPSWSHAYHAWLSGADGGGITYYLLGRALMALTEHSPAVMRVYSAVCMGLGGFVFFRLLRRYYSLFACSLGIGLVWICNLTLLDESLQIRFYGQLVLAFALAVYSLVWVEERKPASWLAFCASFLSTAFLVHTHMLGVFYSGLLLLCVLFRPQSVRAKTLQAAGVVAAWLTLTPFVLAFRSSAHLLNWLSVPKIGDLVRHYLHNPVGLKWLDATDAVNLLLLFCALLAVGLQRRRRDSTAQPTPLPLLVWVAFVMMASPVLIFIISQFGKPIFLARYLLPQLICVSVLVAFALEVLVPATKALRAVIVVVSLVAFTLVQISTLKSITTGWYRYSDLEPLLAMEGTQPVVLFDTPMWEQLWIYGGARGQRFFMFYSRKGSDLLGREYEPMVVFDEDFLNNTPDFLFVDDFMGKFEYKRLGETFLTDPRWTITPRGTVRVRGEIGKVYELRRVQPSVPVTPSPSSDRIDR